MILNQPIFVAESSVELLDRILELVDKPKKSEIREYFGEEAQERLLSNRTFKKISFYERFNNGNDDEI